MPAMVQAHTVPGDYDPVAVDFKQGFAYSQCPKIFRMVAAALRPEVKSA